MPNNALKAKVFVSCGQRHGEELLVLKNVQKVLERRGFQPYVAIWDNTLKGLKENIFRELEDSEYFLFIDFKREPIEDNIHRGSLFCNQELAIASYLDIEAVGFREAGVFENDGMLLAIQLNCEEFEDRNKLPERVAQVVDRKIENGDWNPNWKAQLLLTRDPEEHARRPDDPPFIFHIRVQNRHWRKTAHGCRAFLAEVTHVDAGVTCSTKSFELKWAGTKVPDVTITPGRSRSFDAFEIYPEEPTKLKWTLAHADTEKVWSSIRDAGKYRLTYIVTSQNFWLSRATFELDLKPNPFQTTLTLVDSQVGPASF